jgi:5-oxopent-3-ene-1,2,5-tricarboxylate decarboxylase/2-hydroxyhepta-2,4-diene-1,7-dioate isomerase
MKRARVAYAGAIHEATPHEESAHTASVDDSTARGATAPKAPAQLPAGRVRLADGRVVREDAVVWLPPFEAGTVIALGLNYADHAKELAFNAQDEPLVFLKGPGTLLGHRGQTRRPADVGFMHYECELAVIIGRTASEVPRAEALRHVAGYCIANDYAIRDYLENWYRPNLRVKNRDGGTVLGPWFVDAADVPEPGNLDLRAFVNGKLTQRGNTRDLIFDVPYLIEYLSAFMTLAPGDVILTGTPEGVVNVMPGDEVACEIDGLGRLVNTIVSDDVFGR